MKNIDLNVGGILGALACAGVVTAFIVTSAEDPAAGRGVGKMVVLAVIVGAFAGNYLWGLASKKP